VAHEKGFFNDEGMDVELSIPATAWQVPQKFEEGANRFAVIPWTRVAATEGSDSPLVVVSGSGYEEAAIVVREGMTIEDVQSVTVPQRGGMKDLTAMGLLESLGWKEVEKLRQPSGDGAIISFFGEGADAASMVEPYATMLQEMGVGKIVRRTGDIWPGAPGCCLTTSASLRDSRPELVYRMVKSFLRGSEFVQENPDEASAIAHRYIGVHSRFIRKALENNKPQVNGIRNDASMQKILSLMRDLGYIDRMPIHYRDLTFLDRALDERNK
jgi:ABC-type nitrate/sulfonate/bicarbonate transport system substrate-binding protein